MRKVNVLFQKVKVLLKHTIPYTHAPSVNYRAIKLNLSRDILLLSRDKIECGMSSMGHGTKLETKVS